MEWQWVIIWNVNLHGFLQWLSSSLNLLVPEARKMSASLRGADPWVKKICVHPLPGSGHSFQIKAVLTEVHWRSWSERRLPVGRIGTLRNLLGSINVIQLGENEGGGVFSSSFFPFYQWHAHHLWEFIPKNEGLSSYPLPVLKCLSMLMIVCLTPWQDFRKLVQRQGHN